jgi:hypothetical protein
LVIIEVLEIATLTTRSGYVLRLTLRYALANRHINLSHITGATLGHDQGTHCVGEHLVYVGIKGHSLVLRWALPSAPVAK